VNGGGALALAAELLKVSRLDLTEYLADKPALLLFVDNVREEMLENSQLALAKGVDSGAP
jgi:hypothetical protein